MIGWSGHVTNLIRKETMGSVFWSGFKVLGLGLGLASTSCNADKKSQTACQHWNYDNTCPCMSDYVTLTKQVLSRACGVSPSPEPPNMTKLWYCDATRWSDVVTEHERSLAISTRPRPSHVINKTRAGLKPMQPMQLHGLRDIVFGGFFLFARYSLRSWIQ